MESNEKTDLPPYIKHCPYLKEIGYVEKLPCFQKPLERSDLQMQIEKLERSSEFDRREIYELQTKNFKLGVALALTITTVAVVIALALLHRLLGLR